ncbi:thioredoxin [Candidatus Aerophobetes bacterium]|uniref:Thioredoxin n=1 Tax=Aerophobetes bacterium TaxID=2030807 RepID=A0A2A4YKD4_UNCAE|nr:MAG: thioredoxin [Candidatus Aerophobetes bacterium]
MTDTQQIITLNQDNFDSTISQGVTLVDFYADWCGPCRMLTPVLEEIVKVMAGKLRVGKVDIDANQKIAGTFSVTSVPTMILFKDGKEVNRLVGLRDLDGLKQFVSTVI